MYWGAAQFQFREIRLRVFLTTCILADSSSIASSVVFLNIYIYIYIDVRGIAADSEGSDADLIIFVYGEALHLLSPLAIKFAHPQHIPKQNLPEGRVASDRVEY